MRDDETEEFAPRGHEADIGLDPIDEEEDRGDRLRPERYWRGLRRHIGEGLASVRRPKAAP